MPTDPRSLGAAAWRRSRYCVGESNCVEVADLDGLVGLRNSRVPAATLTFTKAEWSDFVAALKSGEIQLAAPR